MEPLGIFILVVSCAISFGVGRLIMHVRKKNRMKEQAEAARAARRSQSTSAYEEARDGVIKNKAKRKRLLREGVKNRER